MSAPTLWSGPQEDVLPRRPAQRPPAAEPVPAPARRGAARRLPPRPRPLVVDLLAALAGLGLGVTLALGIAAESAGTLRADGGVATALGRLSGLSAAYAMVVVVVLVARLGPLERAIGQDRLVAWHRKLGPWPLYLLTAHAILITVGYARAAHDGLLHQLGQLLWTYPGILASAVAFVLLVAAGVTSYRLARRRLAHETWWSVHLYTYLALFLAFSHQVNTGASFVGHDTTRAWWTALWVGTLVLVLACRVALPVWRSVRHGLRVVGVKDEGPGVCSVLLEGRALQRLPVAGGQFFQWRFLQPGLWWQAHSLSAAPGARHLRITVKDPGDHSSGLRDLKPGTRVAIEGPYGSFTPDRMAGDRVLLVAAGVGATPVRALLQDLPEGTDVIAILRGSTAADLVLREEVEQHVARRRGRVHALVGPRTQVILDGAALGRLVPDLRRRTLYVCGPDGFTRAVVAAAQDAGVPREQIHFESFAL